MAAVSASIATLGSMFGSPTPPAADGSSMGVLPLVVLLLLCTGMCAGAIYYFMKKPKAKAKKPVPAPTRKTPSRAAKSPAPVRSASPGKKKV